MRFFQFSIFISLLSATFSPLNSQGLYLVDHKDSYEVLERFSLKSGVGSLYHNVLKSATKEEVVLGIRKIIDSDYELSGIERSQLQYLLMDNLKKGIPCDLDLDKIGSTYWDFYNKNGLLKYFYRNKTKMLHFSSKHLNVSANPIIHLSFGKDLTQNKVIFQNTRGLSISGSIDNKVHFYSSIFENQQNFMSYLERGIQSKKAIPGQGFYKSFQSEFIKGMKGYDFLNAEANIGFDISKSIGMSFGHGNFFIGDGIRSLLLSDYSHNYLYLSIDTKFRWIHYKNIFAELSGTSAGSQNGDVLLPKKYMASHYLNFRFNNSFEFGIFESVIFSRENQFELQYLNPVILYRTTEQFLGSPDNVLLGLNFSYKLFKTIKLYGQLAIDEFRFNKILENDGWWGNKYGLQAGISYFDVAGIDHLNFQLESNLVRPYTYTHRDSSISYTHYNQALAHPLGANFREVIFNSTYDFSSDLKLSFTGLWTKYGRGSFNENWGNNLLVSSDSRIQENNNHIGQGQKIYIQQYSLTLSYMFYHNFFLDLNVLYRSENMENIPSGQDNFYIGSSFRINIVNNKADY